MSFVDPASDWYSATVPAIINVISYNIRPRYKGTPLYVEMRHAIKTEVVGATIMDAATHDKLKPLEFIYKAPRGAQGSNTTTATRTPAFWGYPRHLMITHIIESYWIPSQKKTKSKLQI